MTCQFDSDNHSKDGATVYHGSETPLHLCCYHAAWGLNLILKGLTK